MCYSPIQSIKCAFISTNLLFCIFAYLRRENIVVDIDYGLNSFPFLFSVMCM